MEYFKLINSLFLENYKNFTGLELNELSRVNVISGQNNTGKTSILESLFMFYDRGSPDLFLKLLALRGINTIELTPNHLWVHYFNSLDISKRIKIKINDSGHITTATYSHDKSMVQSTSIEQANKNLQHNSIQTNTDINNYNDSFRSIFHLENKSTGETRFQIINNQLNLEFKNLEPSRKLVSYVPSSTRGMNNSDADKLGKIDIEQGLDNIVKYLKIIEPKLNSLSIIPQAQQFTVYGDIGLKRKIPLSLMGEGISKLLSILVSISTTPSGIVCIDEIENGIHYSLFPKLWNIITRISVDYNCQLFITTHSNDVLKGLYIADKESPTISNNVSFYRLDNKNNLIKPKHYTGSMLFSAIDREWEVR